MRVQRGAGGKSPKTREGVTVGIWEELGGGALGFL